MSVEKRTLMGIGRWRPEWLQRFNNPHSLTLLVALLGVLQGSWFPYYIAIISTLEKRFSFDSKVTGFILIADNISQMILSPIIGYLGKRYNQAHLIGIGMIFVGLSAYINIIPYFVYGAGTNLISKNISNFDIGQFDLCTDKIKDDRCNSIDVNGNESYTFAIFCLWMASFVNGIGYTVFYTIGMPYVDDNVGKKNSSLHISVMTTFRMFAPTLGFLIASFCLKLYENPFVDPGIDNKDPRWVGAWWIGYLLIGTMTIIGTLPIFLFPHKLKGVVENHNRKVEVKRKLTFQDAWITTKRLLTNGLFMFQLVNGMFRLVGHLGYGINKPKYMEIQFRQSSSSASFFTGSVSIAVMAIGMMLGGIGIRTLKPSSRMIAIYLFIIELITLGGMFGSMFIQCPPPQFSSSTGQCIDDCSCSNQIYQPVCGADGKTNYLTPCFAGCHQFDRQKSKFSDCSCISNDSNGIATKGLCKDDCNAFPYYLGIFAITGIIGTTSRTGDYLLMLRSVDAEDKTFAMGLVSTIYCIFAYIPYPLIFGWIVDSTCLIWDKQCGKKGNCWLYDSEKFRIYFHATALIFIAIGTCFEIGTIALAGNIKDFYGDEEKKEREKNALKSDDQDKNKDPNGIEDDHFEMIDLNS